MNTPTQRIKLKLSVLDLVPIFGGVGSAEALKQAAKLARSVERLGYHRYWVAEHHDLPGLACASPEVLLAHIGAVTSRIRIGSGALLLPHYQPLKVAEAFHMLASLYPGRVDLGVGRAPGGNAHTTMALSGNFLANVHRMPELLRDLKKLLSGGYTYEGESVHAVPVPPEPPQLWLLGTNEKSAAFAAQFEAGYVFGHFMSDADGAAMIQRNGLRNTIVAVSVVCAETEDEAFRLANAGPASEHKNKTIAGAPAQVAEQLRQLAAAYNTDEIMAVTMIPDYAKRVKSYELLAEAAGLPQAQQN